MAAAQLWRCSPCLDWRSCFLASPTASPSPLSHSVPVFRKTPNRARLQATQLCVEGAPPGDSHGADVDADGQRIVTGQRLYQLIRQNGKIAYHTFEIQFLDPGVQAYAFTFG